MYHSGLLQVTLTPLAFALILKADLSFGWLAGLFAVCFLANNYFQGLAAKRAKRW